MAGDRREIARDSVFERSKRRTRIFLFEIPEQKISRSESISKLKSLWIGFLCEINCPTIRQHLQPFIAIRRIYRHSSLFVNIYRRSSPFVATLIIAILIILRFSHSPIELLPRCRAYRKLPLLQRRPPKLEVLVPYSAANAVHLFCRITIIIEALLKASPLVLSVILKLITLSVTSCWWNGSNWLQQQPVLL